MSKDWKDIRINGIASIEKCVAEFCVRELRITPYGKFKVKIYEKIMVNLLDIQIYN